MRLVWMSPGELGWMEPENDFETEFLKKNTGSWEEVKRLWDVADQFDTPWISKCRWWCRIYDPVRDAIYEERTEMPLHHYAFFRLLSRMIPSNAIVVSDTGGNVIMMGHCFQSKNGQRIFTSNGNTPMGFSLCGAIGAWFAEPERPIICIIGDGGMQVNIQELQTIKHYGCNIKVFIINNHILGNTKSYQRVNKKAELACGPDGYSTPDFCKIAQAYGIEHKSISVWAFAEPTVKEVLESDQAVICDVVHHDYCTYEPRMSRWDAPIEEMYPPIPAEDFKNNMVVKPLEGWENRR